MYNSKIVELLRKEHTDKDLLKIMMSDVKRYHQKVESDINNNNSEKAFMDFGSLSEKIKALDEVIKEMVDTLPDENKQGENNG